MGPTPREDVHLRGPVGRVHDPADLAKDLFGERRGHVRRQDAASLFRRARGRVAQRGTSPHSFVLRIENHVDRVKSSCDRLTVDGGVKATLAQAKQHALKRTRRQQAALETRHKLIEAAILCMAEYGPGGVTLDRVTETAGVSHGLVRHHFGGKRQLLISAFDRLADEQRAKFTGRDRTTGIDAVATLRTTVATSLRDAVASRSRAHAWFGFWQAALRDPALGEVNERLYADERSRYIGLFRAAAQQLGLTIDERQAGRGLQALSDGIWNELVIDSREFKIEEALELCNCFIDLILQEGRAARERSSDG